MPSSSDACWTSRLAAHRGAGLLAGAICRDRSGRGCGSNSPRSACRPRALRLLAIPNTSPLRRWRFPVGGRSLRCPAIRDCRARADVLANLFKHPHEKRPSMKRRRSGCSTRSARSRSLYLALYRLCGLHRTPTAARRSHPHLPQSRRAGLFSSTRSRFRLTEPGAVARRASRRISRRPGDHAGAAARIRRRRPA